MNDRTLSLLTAATPAENAVVERAVGWLNDRLAEGGWAEHAVRITARDPRADQANFGDVDIVILSLLPELEAMDEPWVTMEARLRASFAAAAQPGPRLYLCTVFRHVAPGLPRSTLARIRRLNLLATELSRQRSLFVIDVDRALTDAGSRAWATDYRLGGAFAVEAVAHEVATTFLATGFHGTLPRAAQQALEIALGAWEPPRASLEPLGHQSALRRRGRHVAVFESKEEQAAHVLRQALRRFPSRDTAAMVVETIRRKGLRAAMSATLPGVLRLLRSAMAAGSHPSARGH